MQDTNISCLWVKSRVPNKCPTFHLLLHTKMDASPLWMSVVEQESHLSKWLNLGQMFPSLNPAADPLPSLLQPSIYFSLPLNLPFLTITFFTLRLLLTALLSQRARHSCRRRCGAARIDPLPLTWTCHTPNLSFQSS